MSVSMRSFAFIVHFWKGLGEWNTRGIFIFSRMEYADSCIQQPICLCHDHTITLMPPAEPNPPKPNVRSETKSRQEPNPKLVQRFLPGATLYNTAPPKSRCDVTSNGAYKPTLGPFAFTRKKNTASVPFAKSLRTFFSINNCNLRDVFDSFNQVMCSNCRQF